ncbi:MAG: hypothetical protein AAGA29_12715 [Planctomycetota bacterium]
MGSNPTLSAFFPIVRVQQGIERLIDGVAKSYAIQQKVRTDDFEDLTLRAIIAVNPLILKGLRKFERFLGDLPLLGPAAIGDFDLDLDLIGTITKFIALAFEGVALDFVKQPQVQ